jgi:hypothetical protein
LKVFDPVQRYLEILAETNRRIYTLSNTSAIPNLAGKTIPYKDVGGDNGSLENEPPTESFSKLPFQSKLLPGKCISIEKYFSISRFERYTSI